MTTKTTHTPWTVKGVHVGPSKHFRAYTIEPNICEMNSSLAPDEVSANAAHIVRCVNEREELIEVLRYAAALNWEVENKIHAILARAQQEG